LYGRLQREQINLGMIRSRVPTDDDPAVVAQRARIREVRAQLNAVPDVPQAVMPQYAPPVPIQPTTPVQPMQPVQQAQPTVPIQPIQPKQPTPTVTTSQPIAQTRPVAIPRPAVAPSRATASPIMQPAPSGFSPTHIVPPTGMLAWYVPNPAQPPIAQLAPGVPLVVVEQLGAWARVVGSNGWTGWVDGRLLHRRG
jgi:hypothetical protein